MKLRLAILAALPLAAWIALSPAAAQSPNGGHPVVSDISNANYPPLYCQITVTPTATSLASLLSAASCAPIPAWATVAYVTPETAATVAVRWRADGTAPTSAAGDPLFGYAKDPSILGYPAIVNASLISATGWNVTVSVRIGG